MEDRNTISKTPSDALREWNKIDTEKLEWIELPIKPTKVEMPSTKPSNKLNLLYELSKSIENNLVTEYDIDAYVYIYIRSVPIGLSILFDFFCFDTERSYYCEANLYEDDWKIQPTCVYENDKIRFPYWIVETFENNLEKVKEILKY